MLATLRQIVEELSRIPVLEEALQCVAARLTQAMRVDCCTIYLADYEQQEFVLVATDGLANEGIGVRIGFSEGLIGLIGQREEPINIDDAQSHPRFKHYPEVKEESYHAFLGTPIIHQRKVLGVISIQQKSRRRFGEEEVSLLITLAAQMALEVANAEARGLLSLNRDQPAWKKGLNGRPGSPGLAMGIGYAPPSAPKLTEYISTRSKQAAREISRYREAVIKTKADIGLLTSRIREDLPEDVMNIFKLYDQLLDAHSLGREVEAKIKSGWDACTSLKQVVEGYFDQFQQMSDAYMRERAIDVMDLGNRVFAHLLNKGDVQESMPDNTILVAKEVTATMLADCDKDKLLGIICMQGATNSHAAILARAMGVPAVMGLSEVPVAMLVGKEILIDGYSGEIKVAPDASVRKSFQKLVEEEQELAGKLAEVQALEAVTKDGDKIELLLNVGLSTTLEYHTSEFADGVGLFRTEIPFMEHNRFPTENEQIRIYQNLLHHYQGKPVTMRTLDVGGDKPLPYFSFQEENPFLGWRGIRMTLDHPEIFLVQVRAMLRASFGQKNLNIMLPMVTTAEEVREAKRLIRQAFYEVSEEAAREKQVVYKPSIGIMVEVPAVIFQMAEFADIVDFFSVGSNDLTQYLLAVDRNNARVSDLYQSYHPAVLRSLYQIAQQCQQLNKPVTVCGELAGDPGGVLLLLAMGYNKLSVNGHALNRVKWIIRKLDKDYLQQFLQQVLRLVDASDVREHINLHLEQLGAGGLVRAGK
ncbi:MAG: phosphoenolpyruvate--protein phosphotransferase [Aestuariibacter sp.]